MGHLRSQSTASCKRSEVCFLKRCTLNSISNTELNTGRELRFMIFLKGIQHHRALLKASFGGEVSDSQECGWRRSSTPLWLKAVSPLCCSALLSSYMLTERSAEYSDHSQGRLSTQSCETFFLLPKVSLVLMLLILLHSCCSEHFLLYSHLLWHNSWKEECSRALHKQKEHL